MPISTPSDPAAAALLAHILSQTQQNISFLAAQNYISPTEAAELITRLSQGSATSSAASSTDTLANSVNNLALGPARTPEPARRIPPPPARQNVQKARALWAYNEDGREPNDLSFSSGEIIEIVDETNGDWWTGKCRGKQGLFPSNHVEKIDSGAAYSASPPPPPMPMMSMPSSPSYYSPPPGPPQPYGMPSNPEKAALYQSQYAPPPPAPVVVQAPAPVQVQQAPAEPPKKNKFGKLGSTMANSAAGGVGFGAGAAIGSGIVNAIF
ncbi:SH3-domain-containing protein [Lentinus tigrinus ALCF2SS1-7]|uniref:SH3-domain-containing protein n=1 Tax=Lentinus tigrinus ALCF2SS1-6 TaxID=1328759 RepID=A0A5C2SHV6_9APHY|nr:SH3-domain-containing protein [Lentinus tigrinus ALCF2SS1-6]RPD75040.1 SH3-domain-containing protein [Lentinus tigrinus ALCF2SS1-7]